jgi:lipopolysaccharide export system permease protein
MFRLSRYLTRLFIRETLAFLVVAVLLVWITQTLRLFDLVTAKGQDILTLLGQSLFTTPPLALAIIYICMGIGMVRALAALQQSRELHTIHASGRVRALWQAVFAFMLVGIVAVSLIAHWLEPAANRQYQQWSEEIAADLVGRTLNPHRFSEVVPGLVVVIGGRDFDGTIRDFFADDTRDPDAQQTFMADRATIAFDEEGYNISLEDGAIQYIRRGDRFTEVGFSRYELSLDRLVAPDQVDPFLDQTDSITLLQTAISSQSKTADIWQEINLRLAEASRVLAILLVVAAMSAYPSSRRGVPKIPAEALVLILGLTERAVGSFSIGLPAAIAPYFGAICLVFLATILVTYRRYDTYVPRLRVKPA